MKNPAPHFSAETPRKLSEELVALREAIGTRAVTMREVIYRLRGRAYSVLLILLCLPFTQPIPLPGLSTPIGLAIAFIAMRLALGQRPWLPIKLQRKVLPAGFFAKLFSVAAWVLRLLESFLRPRWPLICATRSALQVHALSMLISALVLLLPLPIPFSNTFPGWTILLFAAGMLERDGLFILLGYLTFVLGTAYFILLGETAKHLMNLLGEWFSQ
jgi:hypothetical protein